MLEHDPVGQVRAVRDRDHGAPGGLDPPPLQGQVRLVVGRRVDLDREPRRGGAFVTQQYYCTGRNSFTPLTFYPARNSKDLVSDLPLTPLTPRGHFWSDD